MAGFAQTRARRAGLRAVGRRRPPSSSSPSATARPWRATSSCSRTSATRPTTRRCPRSSSSTTRAAGSIPPRVLVPCAAARRGRARGVPGGAPRPSGRARRAAARRGPRADGAGRAQRRRDAGARAGALAGRPGQDARARSRSWPTRWACRRRRCASSATTSAPSRAPTRSAAWSSSRRAGRAAASTAASASGTVAGHGRLRQPPGGAAAPLPPRARGGGGGRRGAALAPARPRRHRRRQGPGQRRPRGARRARAARPAAGRPGQGARGALPARPRRPDRAARDLEGAVPGPAAARRGAPLRHHLPPQVRARAADALACSTTCPASGRRASARCCASSARRGSVREATVERSRPCRASAARPGRRRIQRRSWTPDRAGGRGAAAGNVPRRMRRLFPILIVRRGPRSRSRSTSCPLPRPARRSADVRRDAPRARPAVGGLRGEYQVVATDQQAVTPDDPEQTRTIIENRVNATGVAEPIVQTQGADRIVVEMPGVDDAAARSGSLIGTDRAARLRAGAAGVYGSGAVAGTSRSRPGHGRPTDAALPRRRDRQRARRPRPDDRRARRGPQAQGDGRARSSTSTPPSPRRRAVRHRPRRHRQSAPVIHAARSSAARARSAATSRPGRGNNLVTVLKFGSLPLEIQEVGFSSISATLGLDFLQPDHPRRRHRHRPRLRLHARSTTACRAWWPASR